MNTVKSVYYGWGSLIVAGAGAYYFAKKSINEDRAMKAEADRKKRQQQYHIESQYRSPVSAQMPMQSAVAGTPASQNAGHASDADWAQQRDEGSPSQEASMDPAPTRHAPEDEAQKMREKSKYEASDVYRSRKGDRFS
ncbi:hypothetical protein M011DRAFT_527977 [Sporormia fimetaria CBS 119925]|uniref:Uncharacterized protein n=1 Tax=Sporormia fimetaria CBS 119925 TaxID=1340428 RepID=A0A6A6V597_9PLEO|nr:hypothetical protein M011DRAFT_527977 [Sporormia fimetaria CBS 119925]